MDKYAALIFDIVDSRKIDNRMIVQEIIKKIVNYLNNYYKEYIKKDVICGAGDEFQGLFKSISSAFSFARKLQLYIYPIKIRCGIGYGTLKYYVEDWMSTEIDGEAYYNARDAIKSIPDKGTNVIFIKTSTYDDKFINTFSLLNSKIKEKETSTARLIELLIDFYCPIDQLNDNYSNVDYEILNTAIKFHIENAKKKKNSINRQVSSPNSNYYDNSYLDIDEIKKQLKNGLLNNKDQNNYYFDSNIPWGIGKLLAPVLHTTSQNINQHINQRGVKDSRSFDIAIIKTFINK